MTNVPSLRQPPPAPRWPERQPLVLSGRPRFFNDPLSLIPGERKGREPLPVCPAPDGRGGAETRQVSARIHKALPAPARLPWTHRGPTRSSSPSAAVFLSDLEMLDVLPSGLTPRGKCTKHRPQSRAPRPLGSTLPPFGKCRLLLGAERLRYFTHVGSDPCIVRRRCLTCHRRGQAPRAEPVPWQRPHRPRCPLRRAGCSHRPTFLPSPRNSSFMSDAGGTRRRGDTACLWSPDTPYPPPWDASRAPAPLSPTPGTTVTPSDPGAWAHLLGIPYPS